MLLQPLTKGSVGPETNVTSGVAHWLSPARVTIPVPIPAQNEGHNPMGGSTLVVNLAKYVQEVVGAKMAHTQSE